MITRPPIPLFAFQTGLTWSAQLFDSSAVAVGSTITTGFSANGNNYLWDPNGRVPDDLLTGSIEFSSNTGVILGADIYQAPDVPTSGSGVFAVTVTVTANSSPIAGAIVSVSDGVQIYSAISDSAGVATFSLNAGGFTVTVSKSGYQHTPITMTVAGSGNTPTVLIPLFIVPPTDPDLTVGWIVTYDAQGQALPSVPIEFVLVDPYPGADTAGASHARAPFTVISDATTCRLEVSLILGGIYRASRDDGDEVDFTAGPGSIFALPLLLGRPVLPPSD